MVTRLDGWLIAGLAGLVGGAAGFPLESAVAAVGGLMLVRGRISRASFVVGLVLFAVTAVRARTALRSADVALDQAAGLTTPPGRCTMRGRVAGSPISRGGALRVDVEVQSADCGDVMLPTRTLDNVAFDAPPVARVYGVNATDIGRGDLVDVTGTFAPVRRFANAELTDRRAYVARTGVTISGGALFFERVERASSFQRYIDTAREHVRNRIVATFHPDAEALARALVLGETDLDDDVAEAFRASGLSHLLAVSGTHLVIAVVALVNALSFILRRVKWLVQRYDVARISSAFGVVAAWLYADFAGGGGSAWRAAAALSVLFMTRAVGRHPSSTRAFAWCLVGGTLVDPLAICDVSFILSMSATAGLLFVRHHIDAWVTSRFALLSRSAVLRVLLSAFSPTLAATLCCAPQLLWLAPTVPIAGLFANVIAAPFGEAAALPLCLLHSVLAIWPAAEQGAAAAGSGALLAVRSIATTAADTGWALALPPPTATQLATIGISLAALASGRFARRYVCALAFIGLLAGEVAARQVGCPTGLLRVTHFDVGQGDATLVDLPDGRAILIDGGGFVGSPVDPGARVLLPALRMRRRNRLAAVILSHPHPDHFGGLLAVVKGMHVDEVWDTGEGRSRGAGPAYDEILSYADANGIPVKGPDELCASSSVPLDVLSPCPGVRPDWSPNDNSFVIRIAHGDHAVLLTGDAEHAAEDVLIERYRNGDIELSADLLKVGHHGSKTSTSPAFTQVVDPSLAVISCGIRNRFGHPHPNTLGTLGMLGIPAARIDQLGQTIWQTDGTEVSAWVTVP